MGDHPRFLPFRHQTNPWPTFFGRFKTQSSISEDPLQSYISYFQ